MNRMLKSALLSLICATGSACSPAPDSQPGATQTLRIGVLPDQAEAQLREQFRPLVEYLSAELDMAVKLIVPNDYGDLLDLFHKREIDLARFGGLSFIQAHQADGAIPVVMRDIDLRFASYFLVQGDQTATKMTDLRGKRLAFGARLSTSGHLMPRYFLERQAITPETFFSSVVYSGAHDRTAQWVRDGEVDIGAANAIVVDQLYENGQLDPHKVRVLLKTPPYADYVWAATAQLPQATRIRVQDAFLSLSQEIPVQAQVLQHLNAGHYLPANTDDFANLERISGKMGMLDAR